jgi:hypothetical protein
VNKKLYTKIKCLEIESEKDWNMIIDPSCIYKQLYSLQIINSFISSPETDLIDEIQALERVEWRS